MNSERTNSLWIQLACLLWGLDLIVRYPISLKIGFVSIVFLESLVGLLFVIPWFVTKGKAELKTFTKKEWLLAFFVGGIGMSAAGYLQTATIQKATPGTFSFFQIWQPILVVFAAKKFLKEKIDSLYLYWGIWVVLSAFLMFSQDIELMFATREFVLSNILVALVCTSIWGLCTIASKKILTNHSVMSLVSLRWLFALLFSSVILIVEGTVPAVEVLLEPEIALRFLFIGAIAGVGAMYLYYSSLKNMAAGKVAFQEVSYSAFGMLLSALYTFEGMTFFQSLGAISFFAFIFLTISRQDSQVPTVVAR